MTEGGKRGETDRSKQNRIFRLKTEFIPYGNWFFASPKQRQLKESNPLARVFVFGIQRENSPAANALTE